MFSFVSAIHYRRTFNN